MATFTNQATLTYNGTTISSNIATAELLEELAAAKTAVVGEYSANGEVTYVISLVNSGTTPFSGLTITDTLGAYTVNETTVYPLTYEDGSITYYINGVLQASPTVSEAQPLTVSNISVPAGGNAIIIYQTRVNEFAPLAESSTIINNATVAGSGIATPVLASETVTAANEPSLAISKNITPAAISENSRVTYTFTIENYGNAAAAVTDNVSITDIFDPTLSDLAVTFNSSAWTEGTEYTYDETSGVFVTTPGVITVPAATYTQDESTGVWSVEPGTSVLTVVGTI